MPEKPHVLPLDFTDQLETAVLTAIDEAVARITGDPNAKGRIDADLKVLLPAIRAQAETLKGRLAQSA